MAGLREYTPRPVPLEASPALREYLDDELATIALHLNELLAGQTYGGMRRDTGQVLSLTATPQILPFNALMPLRGVIADLTNNELTVTVAGDYVVSLAVNAGALGQVLISLEAWLNGVPVGNDFLLEIVTQATAQNATLLNVVTLNKGDTLSIYVSGTPNRDVTFQNQNFYLSRLG